MTSHLVIPDTQVKAGVRLDHLDWVGKLIVDRRPEVIVHLGDHADMESLCSYDKGKKSFEGRRYKRDIESAKEGMRRILGPMCELNRRLRNTKHRQYKPRLVLTLGNHEDRISRAIEYQPELEGVIGIGDLEYRQFGWEVVPYLLPIEIGGVFYSHYFSNKLTGRPHPNSRLMLAREHVSCTQGHVQVKDYEVQYTGDGRRLQGLRAGAFYLHNEEYKGAQGNHHWRGVIYKHDVDNGQYDPEFISIERLQREYGKRNKRKV